MQVIVPQAQHANDWTEGISGKVLLALLGSIFGFVSSYALEQIKRRREPRKQLSWEMKTDYSQVDINAEIKEKVRILYGDTPVENLYVTSCILSNTGNRVIKNQTIRFKLAQDVAILEHYLDPEPEREIGVSKVSDPDLTEREKMYRIDHLERSQQVRFVFVLAGREIKPPTLHPKNEEGDVQFVKREVARVTEDQEHVRPFTMALFFFLVIPVILSSLPTDLAFGGSLIFVIRVLLFIPLIPHIVPVARIVERLIAHGITRKSVDQPLTIYGDSPSIVLGDRPIVTNNWATTVEGDEPQI